MSKGPVRTQIATDASRAAGVVTAKEACSPGPIHHEVPVRFISRAAPTETDADADEATAWPATAQSRASTRDCTLNPLHSHHKALAFARLIKSINGKTPDTINCNTSRYYFYFIGRKH